MINDYLDIEVAKCNTADILKYKNDYHTFNNAECAKATYDYLLLQCPDALFFECCGSQFICATEKATAKLYSKLNERRDNIISELSETNEAIKRLEKSFEK